MLTFVNGAGNAWEHPTLVEFVLNLLERLHNAKELVEAIMKSAQA